jgi:hypothetical protein
MLLINATLGKYLIQSAGLQRKWLNTANIGACLSAAKNKQG